ncbi:hypothetical protein M569_12227, partial [Genlisea aurea]
MGLQSQLSDVSSESVIVLIALFMAKSMCYLRSRVLALEAADSRYDVVGSGIAGLLVLCDQLNLNRILSSPFAADAGTETADCAVCLNRLGEGDDDLVRRLACSHVFHKVCFDSWLHELNFTCPLCRAPLYPDENAEEDRRRVTADLLTWF